VFGTERKAGYEVVRIPLKCPEKGCSKPPLCALACTCTLSISTVSWRLMTCRRNIRLHGRSVVGRSAGAHRGHDAAFSVRCHCTPSVLHCHPRRPPTTFSIMFRRCPSTRRPSRHQRIPKIIVAATGLPPINLFTTG